MHFNKLIWVVGGCVCVFLKCWNIGLVREYDTKQEALSVSGFCF